MNTCLWLNAATSLQLVVEQHAVAEHVAAHVADTGDADRRLADVDAHLAEVALDVRPSRRAT